MKFELYKNASALRWSNASDFVFQTDQIPPPFGLCGDKVLIAFLTYNSSDSAITVIDKISKDCPEANILVVDNCSTAVHRQKLVAYIDLYKSVHLIETKLNLGGAGGYALINELFLRSGYEFLLLTEDDAIPFESDLISKLIDARNESDLVGCQYYNNKSTSFSFHFTLYSRRLIEVAGIPDPRFFQGGDDAEIRDRHYKALSFFGTKPFFISRGYYHPTLKGMGTPAKVIRSQRNVMLTELIAGNYLRLVLRAELLLAYGFFNLLQAKLAVFLTTIAISARLHDLNVAGCKLFKIKGIHSSADLILKFERVNTDQLNCPAGTVHLQSLFGLGRFTMLSKSVLLTTLETPWLLVYIIFVHSILIAKNLSDDGAVFDLARFNVSLTDKTKAVASLFLATIFLPIYMALFFISGYSYRVK